MCMPPRHVAGMPHRRDGVKETRMFSGSIPALVTPFRDGSFDEATFRGFVD